MGRWSEKVKSVIALNAHPSELQEAADLSRNVDTPVDWADLVHKLANHVDTVEAYNRAAEQTGEELMEVVIDPSARELLWELGAQADLAEGLQDA